MKASKLTRSVTGLSLVLAGLLAGPVLCSFAQTTISPLPDTGTSTNLSSPTITNGMGGTNGMQGGGRGRHGRGMGGHRDFDEDTNVVTKAGTVSQYLLNPQGEITGLYLSDSNQVLFPPHLSTNLASVAKSNDNVSITGYQLGDNLYAARSITNTATSQGIEATRPAESATLPLPPILQGMSLQPMTATGTIKALLQGWHGRVDGIILDNGTIIRIDPRASEQFSDTLKVGGTVSAKGFGTSGQYGQSFLATELGSSEQSLTPIYNQPGGSTSSSTNQPSTTLPTPPSVPQLKTPSTTNQPR